MPLSFQNSARGERAEEVAMEGTRGARRLSSHRGDASRSGAAVAFPCLPPAHPSQPRG